MSRSDRIGSAESARLTEVKPKFSVDGATRDRAPSLNETRAGAPAIRDHLERYVAASGDRASALALDTRAFIECGVGAPVVLAGVDATQLPIAESIRALADALTLHPDWPFFVAGFQLDPAALHALLADPVQRRAFLNAVLFKATGNDYQTKYPAYYSSERLELTPVATSEEGAAYLLGKFDRLDAFATGGASPARVSSALGRMMDGLFENRGLPGYSLTWTNHDDAQFHAIVAVDPATGQVRVAGFYPVP